MKIVAKNFRFFLDKEIDIPSTGLVKFEAPSGSGKSTLLTSIIFALFGHIKKPYSFGKTTCKVELYLNDLYILRSKSPNLLKVKINDNFYENDDAQVMINKTIGINYNQFILSSYISQKCPTSIVSLESDKLTQFIQDLIISDEKLVNVKTKIKETLVQSKEFLSRDKLKYDTLLPQLEERKDVEDIVKLEKTTIKLEKEYKLVKRERDDFIQKRDKIKPILENNTVLLNKIKTATIEIEYLESTLKNKQFRKNIEELVFKKKEYLKYIGVKTDLEKYIKNSTESIDYIDSYQTDQEIKDRLVVLKEKIQQEEEKKNIKYKINDILATISTEFKTSVSTILDAFDLLKDTFKTSYSCPNCNIRVIFEKDKLVLARKENWLDYLTKYEDIYLNADEELLKLFQDEEKKLNLQLEDKMAKIQLKQYQRDTKLELENLEKLKVDDVKGGLDTLEKELSIKKNVEEINYNLKLKREYLNKLKTEADSIDSSLIKNTSIEKLNSKIENLSVKLSELSDSLSDIKVRYNNSINNKNINDRIDSIQKKLDTLKVDIKESESEIHNLEELKEIFRKAEIIAFQKMVDDINDIANEYLEKFFSEKLSVKIIPFKETKKEKKTKLSIETVYRGSKYDSLDQVSGGELQRVNLAFMLATNEVVNSKFLFLDECLNNLDFDVNKEIIDLLKEKSDDRLTIVVSHQGINGVFNEIINI
jgi:ABC-type lipoprotein export system ATPase subunit